MKIIGVIPARMESSRFFGKPLAVIRNVPMIVHVYRGAVQSAMLDDVYVATCNEEIRDVVEAVGGKVIVTSPLHERASDRVAEAVRELDADIVVMIQGDEPMLRPEMIDLALEPLLDDTSIMCSNLVSPITNLEAYEDPNTIKVVMDQRGFALYFSREPIPTRRVMGFDANHVYKQVCIIPFRKDFLLTFAQLEPTPLERAESIDMLRILEHGYAVKLVESAYKTHAVDTPEDLQLVETLLAKELDVAE